MAVTHRIGAVLAALGILALAACTEQGSGRDGAAPGDPAAAGGTALIAPDGTPRALPSATPVAPRVVADTTVRGTGRFIAPRAEAAPRGPLYREHGPDEISLNLLDVDIPTAAKAVLGDALGLNYTIEPGIEGRITLQTSTPLSKDALLEAFQTALEFNGATLAESGDLVTITPVGEAPPRFVTAGDTRGVGRQIVVVPLKYISTREMTRLLEPIVSGDTILRVSEERNLLMVSGTRAEIEAILDAVNLFDVDVLAGKSVALVKLRAASPEAVAQELNLIFDTTEDGSLAGVVSFVPNERLGSILVITSRAEYLAEAKAWIQRLDTTAGRALRHAQVYNLQNRNAADLAPILTELLIATEQAPQQADQPGAGEAGLKIVADEDKNALIVWGTETEQEDIARLVRQLDTTPTQVLLEVTIAEVTLNDDLAFGIRWFFESGDFATSFTGLGSGSVAPIFPGFNFLFDSSDARIALDALSSITDVKIVSSPTVLVLDNHEAELQVGDEVPVATQAVVSTADPDAPIVNSITYSDTGVILRVRPRVSENGRVIMDVEQEFSDVVPTTSSGIDSPTIQQRQVRTSAVVDDGQTLALGGLIETTDSVVRTQVPVLGDIPILGLAFRSKDSEQARSELLILITPRVIRDANEGRRITEEFRRQLEAPDQLLDRTRAGPRHQIERILY